MLAPVLSHAQARAQGRCEAKGTQHSWLSMSLGYSSKGSCSQGELVQQSPWPPRRVTNSARSSEGIDWRITAGFFQSET